MDFYYKPWSHLPSFLVGLAVGLVLADLHIKLITNPTAFNSKKYAKHLDRARIIHQLSIVMLMVLAFSLYPWNAGWNVPQTITSVYASTVRTAWALALTGFLYYLCIPFSSACTPQTRGYLYELLAWPGFQFTSKLSYCMYLLHPIVIWFHYAYLQRPLPATAIDFARFFAANFLLTQLLSVVLCLLFESPINRMQRLMLSFYQSKRFHLQTTSTILTSTSSLTNQTLTDEPNV